MFFLILTLAFLPATESMFDDECPPEVPVDYYLQIYGDHCYQFVLYERRDYRGASDYCTGLGGTLALVKSSDVAFFLENQIIHRYFRHNDVWIGLTNALDKVTYVWADGSQLDYTNWALSQATAGSGEVRCVSMDPSEGGRWHANPCSAPAADMVEGFGKSFVCQYDRLTGAGLHTTTTSPATSTTTTTTMNTGDPPFTDRPTAASTPTTTTPVEETEMTPLSPTTDSTLILACPAFSCDLDCGMDGFKKNSTSECSECECDV